MRKQFVTAVVALGFGSLALAGCGSSSTASKTQDTPATSASAGGSSGPSNSSSSSNGISTPTTTDLATLKAQAQSYGYPELAKNADSLAGKPITGQMCIFQFDGATGNQAFLGNYTYDSSADFWSDTVSVQLPSSSVGQNVYQGDIVNYWGVIEGTTSYDTQSGGNSTVPAVLVQQLEVTGHNCA